MGSKKQTRFGDIGAVEIWAQALRGEDEETELCGGEDFVEHFLVF